MLDLEARLNPPILRIMEDSCSVVMHFETADHVFARGVSRAEMSVAVSKTISEPIRSDFFVAVIHLVSICVCMLDLECMGTLISSVAV